MCDQSDHKKHQKDKEKYFRDAGGCYRNSTKTKRGCDDRDDQEK